MYIVKVDLIDQVVSFILLLVLHQLTLQVQVINFLSTSHLFIISSSQIFIFSPHHLINFLSRHLIILSTYHLFIFSRFFSFLPFNFSSSLPYISSQPSQKDPKIILSPAFNATQTRPRHWASQGWVTKQFLSRVNTHFYWKLSWDEIIVLIFGEASQNGKVVQKWPWNPFLTWNRSVHSHPMISFAPNFVPAAS